MAHILRIGAVAREVGVSSQTIRSLELRGLISPRRDWDGNRVFSPDDIPKIRELLFPTEERDEGK